MEDSDRKGISHNLKDKDNMTCIVGVEIITIMTGFDLDYQLDTNITNAVQKAL